MIGNVETVWKRSKSLDKSSTKLNMKLIPQMIIRSKGDTNKDDTVAHG